MIDPKNPFANETEFADYNSDYGEIVPQIRMEGCEIPLFPNARERRRIRKYQNIVGGYLFCHLLLMNVLTLLFMEGYLALQKMIDSRASGGTLPENYLSLASEYFENSSSYMAVTMLVIASCSVLVVWFGCKSTKIPISTLFQTKEFSPSLAVSYVAIALLLQNLTGWIAVGIDALMEGVGVSDFTPDLGVSQNLRSVIVSFVYSVIVAPITEELLVRGFVMKNLCRCGQRFGIIMSAFFFGVWHENIAQFVLAFAAGCFFGYITVKHNSLIPSMICHICVNLSAEIFDICDNYNWDMAYDIFNVLYVLMVIAGLILLIRMMILERFPRSTPHQAERGLRIALTSPLLMLVLTCHIASAVLMIINENS